MAGTVAHPLPSPGTEFVMRRPALLTSPSREFRVSFADRLADAVVVATDTPLPPLRIHPLPPDPTPTHTPAAAPPSADLWVTEIGAQLAADRRAIETVLGSLTTAADALTRQHTERLGEWRAAAVELAVSIAAKLLHERITAEEFAVEQMVRDMAADMTEDEVVSVRLNPKDLELLEKRLDGQPLLSGPDDPQLIADNTLGRGECRVEGKASLSLSALPRQLGQIRDDLLRSIAHARP
jgi:hypothetical protein